MNPPSIDHVAIPILNIEAMLSFYQIFGFEVDRSLAPQLYAVTSKSQKMNFHAPVLWQNSNFKLRGPTAQPGCGDFCFYWDRGIDELKALLKQHEIPILEGPVPRIGGRGRGTSLYVRDPDQNLVEFISYDND